MGWSRNLPTNRGSEDQGMIEWLGLVGHPTRWFSCNLDRQVAKPPFSTHTSPDKVAGKEHFGGRELGFMIGLRAVHG